MNGWMDSVADALSAEAGGLSELEVVELSKADDGPQINWGPIIDALTAEACPCAESLITLNIGRIDAWQDVINGLGCNAFPQLCELRLEYGDVIEGSVENLVDALLEVAGAGTPSRLSLLRIRAPYCRLRVDEFTRLFEAGAVLHLKCLELLEEDQGEE